MLALFFIFYEYRCSRRTFWTAVGCVIGSISAVMLYVLFTRGVAAMGQLGLLIGTVPTLLLFYALARDRGPRFVFIFCLADTVNIWLELASGLIDFAVHGQGIVTLALRVVSYPILEYAAWRWLRRPFLEIRHTFRHGWTLFALLTGTCYVLLAMVSIYPTVIYERPQDIPAAVLLLVLVALTYVTIFLILFEQLRFSESQSRQRIFQAQAVMMSRRVEDMRRAQESMRIERHDMRHHFQTIAGLARRGDCEALLEYIGAFQENSGAAMPRSCCSNPVLDAVLVHAAEQAEAAGIALEMAVQLPAALPTDALDLSIVFANALENAMRAVVQLPEERRRIVCKTVASPRLMIEIANPFEGEVAFSRDGLPLAREHGHGIGTRSIVAFAEKYRAICRFRAENGWFKLQMVI